jgi:hypothetical protein
MMRSAQRWNRSRHALELLRSIVGRFDAALGAGVRERLVDQRSVGRKAIVEDRREARAPAMRDVPAGIAGGVVELADRALADRRRGAGREEQLAGAGGSVEDPDCGHGLARQRDDVLGRGIRLPDLGQLHPRRRDPPQRPPIIGRNQTDSRNALDLGAQRRRAASPGARRSARGIATRACDDRRRQRGDVGHELHQLGRVGDRGLRPWTGRGLSSSLIRAAGSALQIRNGMPNRNTPEIRSRSRRAVSIRPRLFDLQQQLEHVLASIELGSSAPIAGKTSRSRLARTSAACSADHRGDRRSCQRLASCSKVSSPRGRVDFYVNIPVELVARLNRAGPGRRRG